MYALHDGSATHLLVNLASLLSRVLAFAETRLLGRGSTLGDMQVHGNVVRLEDR